MTAVALHVVARAVISAREQAGSRFLEPELLTRKFWRTAASIQNITALIEENSESAENMSDIFDKLLQNIEHLDKVSDLLNENMDELKKEISLFRVE